MSVKSYFKYTTPEGEIFFALRRRDLETRLTRLEGYTPDEFAVAQRRVNEMGVDDIREDLRLLNKTETVCVGSNPRRAQREIIAALIGDVEEFEEEEEEEEEEGAVGENDGFDLFADFDEEFDDYDITYEDSRENAAADDDDEEEDEEDEEDWERG